MHPVASAEWVALWLAAPLFIAIIWSDLSRMRIPNSYALAGLALFAACIPFIGFETSLLRSGIALGAFLLGVTAFAFGLLGGGDVKIFPDVILFIPQQMYGLFLGLFSASLLIGIVAVLGLRRAFGHPEARLAAVRPGREYPMGLSIGGAGLALLGASFLPIL